MNKNKKLKILLVTEAFPPPPGGIQTVAHNLYTGLIKSGYNVKLLNFDRRSLGIERIKFVRIRDFFYTPATKNVFFRLSKILNPFRIFNPNGGLKYFIFMNMLYRETEKIRNKFHPDITHIINSTLYPCIYNCPEPTVITCHSEEIEDIYSVIYSLNNATKIHCVSNYTKNKVLTFIPNRKEDIEVIYNSIDLSFFKNRKKIKKKNQIITICRLHKRKNVDSVIKAFSYLPNNILKKYTYIIVGDGPEKKYLEKLTKKLGIKNVIFTGFVSESDKIKFLLESKLFVMCSKPYEGEEGFGISFIEAQAAGLPVIGSNVGGIPDAVGDGGILVKKPTDSKEIAKKIRLLLTNQKIYNKLKKNISKRIKQFDKRIWIRKIISLYKHTLN